MEFTFNYFSDGKNEIDFVITRPKKVFELIQVSKDISDSDTLKREINGLERAAKLLKPNKLVIVNEDKEEIINSGGLEIELIPLWKYLLK